MKNIEVTVQKFSPFEYETGPFIFSSDVFLGNSDAISKFESQIEGLIHEYIPTSSVKVNMYLCNSEKPTFTVDIHTNENDTFEKVLKLLNSYSLRYLSERKDTGELIGLVSNISKQNLKSYNQ